MDGPNQALGLHRISEAGDGHQRDIAISDAVSLAEGKRIHSVRCVRVDVYRRQEEFHLPAACRFCLVQYFRCPESRRQLLGQHTGKAHHHVRHDHRNPHRQVHGIVSVEALPPVPDVEEVRSFASYRVAQGAHPRKRRVAAVIVRSGQEAQAFLLDQLDHRSWRREEYYFVTVEVAERCGELDGVRLGATYLKFMGKDEDLHVVPSTESVRKK